MCARILRREADHLPFTSNFVIFDDDDQTTLVKRAIRDLNLDREALQPVQRARRHLQRQERADPARRLPDRRPTATRSSRASTRATRSCCWPTTPSISTTCCCTPGSCSRKIPACARSYARRFEHVLVDEFQDTNLAQYELLRHLASIPPQHLSWSATKTSPSTAGAAPITATCCASRRIIPDCQKILLEQNYRSTQTILDAAQAVIDRNHHRTPKKLRSIPDRGAGDKLTLYEAVDDHGEAAFVVDTIQQLVVDEARAGRATSR